MEPPYLNIYCSCQHGRPRCHVDKQEVHRVQLTEEEEEEERGTSTSKEDVEEEVDRTV